MLPVDGDHSLQDDVFDPVLRPEQRRRTVSPLDIENAGGRPAAEVIAMIKAFGLSCSGEDEPFFTDEEARAMIELAQHDDLWPRETSMHVARVYGQALATIAHAEVQSFLRRANTELEAADAREATLRSIRAGLEELLPLANPLLLGVHRRWIEHELAQTTVHAVEDGAVEDGAGAARLETTHVALLFVDIKGFTSYVDTAGDAAGIAAIEQFDEVVVEEQGENGRVVKALGDGFMLAYPTGAEAVDAGWRMIRRMPRELGPALHASVHEGPALHRGGDYFGRTVNLAARLLGLSGTGELVATRAVADATQNDFSWEPRASTHIRGFRDPIGIYRLVGPR